MKRFRTVSGGNFMNATVEKSLPRASFPEEVGVSSSALADYIRDVEESGIESHSLMILRHGKVAYETWREPYTPDLPHTMYSVSKSIISTAAGFAVNEGLLTLDTKLLDVFPEYRTNKRTQDDEKITLRTLLTMTAGKDVSLFSDKTSETWVKDFLDSRWCFKPGEGWKYISENTYCVGAMISRLTGMTVTEYLTPRLYEPLGIEVPAWERDAHGVETGGWGIFLKTEDLAKIALCYLNHGQYMGKQVIPEAWTREATQKQADNSNDVGIDNTAGYGYFFWRCGNYENAFRFDGMFSQFAIVFEDLDAVIITTNNEVDEQKTRDAIWRHFPAAFIEDTIPEQDRIPTLKPLTGIPPQARSEAWERKLNSHTIKITPNKILAVAGYPLSVLCFAAVYMSADKAGPMDNIKFSFYEDECTMYWSEGDETNIIHIGMDGVERLSHIRLGKLDYTAASTAAWTDKNTLDIWIRPLEAVGQRRLKFTFRKGCVLLKPTSMPTLRSLAVDVAGSLGGMFPNPTIFGIVRAVMRNLDLVLEPIHHGKIV
ncbi:MAG TPA: hypothetical protein DDY98_00340 [Ruminococcaceae bacterium]|nr:hypothetical protein [Oscillospiraceae bacterium]